MCPPRRPKAPTLPPPRPTAPAPERTAQSVRVGSERGQDGKTKTERKRKPTGTDTLRIPVTMSSNLRY